MTLHFTCPDLCPYRHISLNVKNLNRQIQLDGNLKFKSYHVVGSCQERHLNELAQESLWNC